MGFFKKRKRAKPKHTADGPPGTDREGIQRYYGGKPYYDGRPGRLNPYASRSPAGGGGNRGGWRGGGAGGGGAGGDGGAGGGGAGCGDGGGGGC